MAYNLVAWSAHWKLFTLKTRQYLDRGNKDDEISGDSPGQDSQECHEAWTWTRCHHHSSGGCCGLVTLLSCDPQHRTTLRSRSNSRLSSFQYNICLMSCPGLVPYWILMEPLNDFSWCLLEWRWVTIALSQMGNVCAAWRLVFTACCSDLCLSAAVCSVLSAHQWPV